MRVQNKLVAATLAFSCNIATLQAEPLMNGTVLTIETGNADTGACTVGSCFGMEVSPGFWIWTNITAGTDGGLVVGKNQLSGGQELGNSATNSIPGELSAAWFFVGAYGTFFTGMGDANIFDDRSCTDTGCDGKTILSSFDVAWNGSVIPVGSEGDVCCVSVLGAINWLVNNDTTYSLEYIHDAGTYPAQVDIRVLIRGEIQPPVFVPPTAAPVTLDNISGLMSEWVPDVAGAGGYPVFCSIASQPANGEATIDPGCTYGTYQSVDGFTGVDTFSYTVTSGFVSDTAIVTANVSSAECESVPIHRVTTVGGGQSQSINSQLTTTFTGKLTTQLGLTSGAKNKVTICPGSSVSFDAVSSVGATTCSINGIVTGSSGKLFVEDKLICANKPDGSDTDRFSVKSGE